MPIMSDAGSVNFLSDTVSLVKLEGITHLVLEPDSDQARKMRQIDNIEDKKSFARQLLTNIICSKKQLEELWLLPRTKAC